mmetsp:Transcript_43596/g.135650  ORF Transcript_43596/g.135650 Transcript_43596/m.135650 type:complete len:339 (-) Transcript_43596:82-1098(-)
MMSRTVCLLLLAATAYGQVYDFCKTGIPRASFAEDGGKPSIDVILAVAPLFSTNPKIGGKLGMLGLYHTALALAQKSPSGETRYWTLEFDFTKGSIIAGAMPTIDGEKLSWDNDARYCLTDGLLWGRDHWKKQFDTVMTISKEQAERMFDELVFPVNSTAHGSFPQYQLWRVVRSPGAKLPGNLEGPRKQHVLNLNTMVGDVTCADGINWVLNYIKNDLGVPPHQSFQYKGTTVWVTAHKLEKVDVTDPAAWAEIVSYYSSQRKIVSNVSMVEKVMGLPAFFPMKFIYNANTNTYFRVHGNRPPYMHIEYAPSLLLAPPFNYGKAHTESAEVHPHMLG